MVAKVYRDDPKVDCKESILINTVRSDLILITFELLMNQF